MQPLLLQFCMNVEMNLADNATCFVVLTVTCELRLLNSDSAVLQAYRPAHSLHKTFFFYGIVS
jgi:hypothetical protein